jgi:hypothetical protein
MEDKDEDLDVGLLEGGEQEVDQVVHQLMRHAPEEVEMQEGVHQVLYSVLLRVVLV